MTVEQVKGSPTWFYVQGSTQPYLVELEELDFNGWCSCHSFYFTHYPRWRADWERGVRTGPHRCKHLAAAREYALDLTLRQYVERNDVKPKRT